MSALCETQQQTLGFTSFNPTYQLARQALAWRDGGAAPARPETLAFIRYTIDLVYA